MKEYSVSVIIPVFNEVESINQVLDDVSSTLKSLGIEYEILVVDDGSTDQTSEMVKRYSRGQEEIRLLQHKRNFGKTAALLTGFRNAKGDVVFMMDGDGQFSGKDIPKFLNKIDEGSDVINGYGIKKEPLGKKIVSGIFNTSSRILWGMSIHQFNIGYKCFKKEAIKDLKLKPGEHRYILPILKEKGYKIDEIRISYYPRRHGRTKYGSIRLLFGVLDMVGLKLEIMFKDKPMRFFGVLGIFFLGLGCLLTLYSFLLKFMGDQWTNHIPLMFSITVTVFIGLQSFYFGFLAESMASIREDIKDLKKKN